MNQARHSNSGGDTSSSDVDSLLAAEPQELTDGEVIDGVLALTAHVGQAQAALARMAATFDTRCLATIDGARLGAAKVEMLLDARVDLEDLFAEHEAVIVAEVAPLTVAQAAVVVKDWRRIALATVGNDDGPEPGEDPDLNAVHLSATFQNRWRPTAASMVNSAKRWPMRWMPG